MLSTCNEHLTIIIILGGYVCVHGLLNVARAIFPIVWLNDSLDIAIKVFFIVFFLDVISIWIGRLWVKPFFYIIWVSSVQSVEGFRRKNRFPKKEGILPPDCCWTQYIKFFLSFQPTRLLCKSQISQSPKP